MECSHFKKANFCKRLMGVEGYCIFHQTNIKQCIKINYSPYICCKANNGETFKDCAVQLRISRKDE
jgi:hypothetical protein